MEVNMFTQPPTSKCTRGAYRMNTRSGLSHEHKIVIHEFLVVQIVHIIQSISSTVSRLNHEKQSSTTAYPATEAAAVPLIALVDRDSPSTPSHEIV
mmetsp:Transcript_18289/g.44890  ORF Transcript_18289/g.44890 Transcript_18289/m.44890 type:complete len:96 (+) Transcript_18289:93-380(+)